MSNAPKIRIGIQPTGWTNDDFPEIGNGLPYQQILDQTKEAGFEGGSTGHNYPSHLPSLLHDLQTRHLGITSTWVGTKFTAPDQYDATLQFVRDQVEFLHEVGATDIVVAELANAVNQVRTKAVLTDRPIFNEAQWYLLTRGLDEAGKIAADKGMRLSFHPHVGSGVQQAFETRRLMHETDPKYVWLCIDTGHTQFAGDDPRLLAEEHAKRIGHVHLKSVRQAVVDAATAGKYSFYRAILEGVFTVPGDPAGAIDFKDIFGALKAANFSGWIVVEAEQDPAKAPPLQYAKMARAFIKKEFGV
jgi:inosose dehydratase